jgi:hypothetical protein
MVGVKYDYRIDRLDDSFALITEINRFTGDSTDMSFLGKINEKYMIKDFDFDNSKHQMTSRLRMEYVLKSFHPEFFL